MTPLPEQDLIRSIREGDSAAFRQVFDTCYDSLCRYAFTILRDTQEAEDTVQSMFLKIWEKRSELEIRQSIRSYLFRSVYNQCLNLLEHGAVRRKHRDRLKEEMIQTVAPEVFTDELDDKIKQAIETLPAQCRAIFVMSRYEDLKYSEIAERLNISVNTIQNQVCKALRMLREELKDIIV